MPFGQLVIGPPGSGKSSYCFQMAELIQHEAMQKKQAASDAMDQIPPSTDTPFRRSQCAIINLDPGNDRLPYQPAIDICDLITQQSVMEEQHLGPNGALIRCMEYLSVNMDWLETRLDRLIEADPDTYFLFDCPGQVELFTCNQSLKTIVDRLQQFRPSTLNPDGAVQFRICAVHLVDASHCTDPGRYISVLLVTLKAMLHLELPQVNVLSKVDLMEAYDTLAFDLEYYTEVQNLEYLVQRLDADPLTARFGRLNRELCELIEDFGLVRFYTLSVDDSRLLVTLLRAIDKANGFIYGALVAGNESVMQVTARVGRGYLEDVDWVSEQFCRRLVVEREC